ncbi:MAG: hypothetical protein ABSC61_07025 [Anaerolineales bacterium]
MEIRQRSRRRNRIIGAILFGVSILFAGFAIWPTIYRTENFPLRSDLLPQEYQLVVQYPALGPSGDAVTLKVTLKPVGPAPAADSSQGLSPGLVAEVQSPTLAVNPSGQILTALTAGRTLHMSWNALSQTPGEGHINLFLFKEGAEQANGVFLQQPLWARSFPFNTFAGPGGMRVPILYLSTFGILFGLGFLLMNSLGGNSRRGRPSAGGKIND